jgi:hypothetical protein
MNLKTNKLISIFIIVIFACTTTYANSDVINHAAQGAMMTYMVTTVGNAEQGDSFVKKCTGSAWYYCAMAALAFTQAAMALKGASDSNKTKTASDCTGPYCGGGVSDGIDPGSGNGYGSNGGIVTGDTLGDPDQTDILGRIQNDVNKNLADLGKKGYSYDPKTNSVDTPNNGSVPVSAFSSPSGMKGLGLSDAEIADVQKVAAAGLKAASKYAGSADYDSAGGGGGLRNKGSSDEDEAVNGFDMNKYLAGLTAHKKNSRGVAGLEKNYGSDQIGVSQDNIFKMIHRRYEAKKTSLTP